MILTCPECGTQYVVKDGAIPPGGRQVRCASCKHSWHQEGDPPEDLNPAEEEEVSYREAEVETGEQSEPVSEASTARQPDEEAPAEGPDTAIPPGFRPLVATPEPAFEEPVEREAEWDGENETVEDEFAPFGPRDYAEEPRRSTLGPVVLLVLLIAAAAVAFWFLAPAEWKSKVGLAEAAETKLQVMATHADRHPLASGNELLAVTGRVINPTDEIQTVPSIQAQLRGSSGEIVYSWTIAPPARRLPPGESATFNSAEVNVPAGADLLTFTLGAPRA